MDEAQMPDDLYTQYPRFNSMNTEVFYTEIETALRGGATPLTLVQIRGLVHAENIADDKPEWSTYSEDFLSRP